MENVSDFSQFIGRLHLVLLHLPIGLLLLLAALELLSLNPAWRQATAANRHILVLTAPVAVMTAACGWLLAGSGGYDERLLFLHRWTGVAVAVTASVLLFVHARGWLSVYRPLIVAAVPLTIVAGHFGGSLTHGRGYLTHYAPTWLRGGLAVESVDDIRPDSLAAIQPVLTDYCMACHGPEKSKGGLRVDTIEHLLAGGESGPAVLPGDLEASLLFQRLVLPLEHDDHMPPEGKSQPSTVDIQRIRSWILTGASE